MVEQSAQRTRKAATGPRDIRAATRALTARLDMRFAAPLRQVGFARRTWFSVTLAAILVVHGILLALFLWRDSEAPPRVAALEETPVEVVVQPPPPEPPQAKPQDKPPAAPPAKAEKPATSAPRAANDETLDRLAADKETRAPKSDVPKTTDATPPTPAPASPEKTEADAKPDQADPPKPPDVLEKDAEALDKLPPEPPKKPAKLAKAKPVKVPPTKSAVQQLAGASDLPDYTFAKPMRKRAKVTGGTEDDRYLAVVYGMITQNRREIDLPGGSWYVTVAFQVDGAGNLVSLQLQHRSGFQQVDAAAIDSVRRAAPFPPPPSGVPTGLVARLHSAQDPRAAQVMDE